MQSLIDSLLPQVVEIARETGHFIFEQKQKLHTAGIEEKSANNLVTAVDKAAESMLVSRLLALLPDSNILGEEGGEINNDSALTWIIDPIDGTTNFVHDLPLFCISIALQAGNDIVLGVINDISHKEIYTATSNEKAKVNGQEIRVSDCDTIQKGLFVTGFPYHEEKLEESLELYKHFIRQSRGIRRLGSAALDMAYVARGRFEAFYEIGLSAWDVAAGSLIVQQAGGQISDFRGGNNAVFGKNMLASNGRVHPAMLSLLKTFRMS